MFSTDTPGSWFVDHPNSRNGVKRIVAGMVCGVALAVPASAAAAQTSVSKGDHLRPTPGSIGGDYQPRRSGSVITL